VNNLSEAAAAATRLAMRHGANRLGVELLGAHGTDALVFSPEELTIVATCCQTLELTPRATKRVANALKLFRLVWARRGRGQPSLEQTATVAMIVGLSAAHPEVQRDAFALLESSFTTSLHTNDSLGVVLERLPRPCGKGDDPEVQRYQRWLVGLGSLRQKVLTTDPGAARVGDIPLRAAAPLVQFVAAFCFVGDDLPRLDLETI
jgi:hypothetical protein